MHTVGELGTRAKAGRSIDGRQYPIYEAKAAQRMANCYLYTEGLDTSDQSKEVVAEWLCKKAGVSSEGMQAQACDWRVHKSIGIVGTVALVMPDHMQVGVFRLGKPVEGTSNVNNAEISIDEGDVNFLLLSPETTKVDVGGRRIRGRTQRCTQQGRGGVRGGPERRSRGGRRGEQRRDCQQLQAGMEAQTAASAEREGRSESNFARIIERANADSAANQARVDALQRNLMAAHTALTMQSDENALQASIAVKNSELASRTLMARMEELAADGNCTTSVLMKL